MGNQKIINLLDKIDTDSKHFATKKWYIINYENNTNYDTISLSRHEQVCLMRLRFERYFSHHRAM